MTPLERKRADVRHSAAGPDFTRRGMPYELRASAMRTGCERPVAQRRLCELTGNLLRRRPGTVVGSLSLATLIQTD